MASEHFPYRFIAVEGNIGAGKTTLCRMMAEDFGFRLILEQFADNPFLPYFYENPDRYAFSVELFFMTERHKQLQEELAQQDLFHQAIISDYYFFKTLLFARNTLPAEEFRLFQRLFHILNATFPKPDILLYLHRSIEDLKRNIKKRGREYEQEIKPTYLQKIQNAYFEFFKTDASLPILVVDIEEVDFVNERSHYDQLLEILRQQYPPGMHHINIS